MLKQASEIRFLLAPAGQITREHLTGLVDALAGTQVSVMLVCCCAQRVNFPSRAWQTVCDGFDPSLGDDQPFFGDLPRESRPDVRRWAHNVMKLLGEALTRRA